MSEKERKKINVEGLTCTFFSKKKKKSISHINTENKQNGTLNS